MVRQRPTAVLVMAILNLVFGGLGLLALLCGVGSILLVKVIPTPPGAGPNPALLIFDVPGYTAFAVVGFVSSLVTGTLLIVSGIGLLKMRPWARALAILYGVVAILSTAGNTVAQLAYFNPATAKLMAEQPNMPGPAINLMNNPIFSTIMTIGGAVLGMAYAVALLIVMFRASVIDAFAGKGVPVRADPEDYYDDREDDEAVEPRS